MFTELNKKSILFCIFTFIYLRECRSIFIDIEKCSQALLRGKTGFKAFREPPHLRKYVSTMSISNEHRENSDSFLSDRISDDFHSHLHILLHLNFLQ